MLKDKEYHIVFVASIFFYVVTLVLHGIWFLLIMHFFKSIFITTLFAYANDSKRYEGAVDIKKMFVAIFVLPFKRGRRWLLR